MLFIYLSPLLNQIVSSLEPELVTPALLRNLAKKKKRRQSCRVGVGLSATRLWNQTHLGHRATLFPVAAGPGRLLRQPEAP